MSLKEYNSAWLRSHRESRTAIHEAGHAIVAFAEGRRFEDVVLEQAENRNGSVRNLWYRCDDDDIVRILLAGIMAARLARNRWDPVLFITSHDDIRLISEFWANRQGSWKESMTWNVFRTEQLLVEHWTVVERLAARLIQLKLVRFETVSKLHDEASSDVRFANRPFGKLGSRGWTPLLDHLEFRLRYPDGIHDLLKEAHANKDSLLERGRI